MRQTVRVGPQSIWDGSNGVVVNRANLKSWFTVTRKLVIKMQPDSPSRGALRTRLESRASEIWTVRANHASCNRHLFRTQLYACFCVRVDAVLFSIIDSKRDHDRVGDRWPGGSSDVSDNSLSNRRKLAVVFRRDHVVGNFGSRIYRCVDALAEVERWRFHFADIAGADRGGTRLPSSVGDANRFVPTVWHFARDRVVIRSCGNRCRIYCGGYVLNSSLPPKT